MNTIYLRRCSKVILPEGSGSTPTSVLEAMQKNLESLGFMLSEAVIEGLKRLDFAQLESFYHRLVKDLRAMVGTHREFRPFYPNFPRQVTNLSRARLCFNAIVHYWTLGRPEYAKEERPALSEQTPMRVLELGSREDFEAIFTRLARSKSPYSEQDQEDVRWFVAQYRAGIFRLLPESIPSKENLALLGAALLRNIDGAEAFLAPRLQTATDVLRLAAALSDGDVSLASACKFGKFRRRERVLLLGAIECAAYRTEDMLRWKPRWIRLGERLHPGEYEARFPETAAAFDVLRNDRPFQTFNGRIEAGLEQKNVAAVLDLLQDRPGELARRLDHLARLRTRPDSLLARFERAAERVSTPVLLQVMNHFRRRPQPAPLRVFFPKGNVGNLFATEAPLPELPVELCTAIAATCERALLARFAALPPLGACYLDPRLESYLVPFSQRSAAKSLRTLVRGSRLPLPECSTLRFFVWWRNSRSRVDIDLSAAMYGEAYRYVDTLAYYNLKNFGAHHSGDIVNAPNGAAEFIDIDIGLCLKLGVRFVVMCVNSFTQQAYCDLPECFAGWMGRQQPNSGEIFEPRTVVDRVDIASDTKFCLPAIFDLVNREVIWADIALATSPRFANNVHNHLSGVSLMLRAMTQLRKTDLYTLFDLHIRARGESVSQIDAAETVFAVDRGLTPFDLDRISADYL